MSTITVNTTAALEAALATAHAGETIQLAAGTYAGVAIQNFNSAGTVTITSADPTHQAVITGMSVAHSSGLDFTGLNFSFAEAATDAQADASVGVTVQASSHITFNNDNFHGVLNGDPTLDIKGLSIQGSSSVAVENSQFQDLRVGMIDGDNNGVTISGDYFHDIRVDGIDNFGASNVTISGNDFTDFYRQGNPEDGGDHPDAIQFWTTGTTTEASNISIQNNVIVQGQGLNMQGVFMQADASLPFQNVTISGNMVVGGSTNALYVQNANGLQMSGNTVTGLTSQNGTTPHVVIEGVTNAQLTSNSAMKFVTTGDTGLVQTSDSATAAVSDGGLAAMTSWLHAHAASGLLDSTQLVGLLGVDAGSTTHLLG